MRKGLAGWRGVFKIMASGLLLFVPATPAASLQSASYRFDESTVGSGGLIRSSSTNFQTSSSLSDLAVGDAVSSNFQVNNGSQTTPDPTLSFAMNSIDANFGNFSATSAATTTASFSVANYTSYGYVVQIAGTPPTSGSHTINPMTTTDTSKPGIDQFGINMVANTAPVSFGANPNQGQFGSGAAAQNYNTPNMFRYVPGETIASSPKSSGETIFTISYLVNVAPLTPGGMYTGNQTLIVTGTF